MDIRTPTTGYPEVATVEGAARSGSAVSWSAISAGAVVAASTTLLLIALGGGVGLASLSPWPHAGASATTFAVMTAIGLIVVQWVSAAVGGYIAGRLRTKWIGVHTHEVFFRDTAHGFITWASATLLIAVASAVIASSTLAGGVHAAATVASGAAMSATSVAAQGTDSVDPYDVDTLLRSSSPDASPGNDARPQVTRILAKAMTSDQISADDRAYLTQVVAARAGVSPTEAQSRVDSAVAKIQAARQQAREAADAARKAARSASIFTALAMLIGAFIASISAALGGRLRDLHP
jgi:hypothetical protein